MDSTGVFLDKYTYPDSVIFATKLLDIESDGHQELYLYMTDGRHIIYKKENPDELPIVVDFIFYISFI